MQAGSVSYHGENSKINREGREEREENNARKDYPFFNLKYYYIIFHPSHPLRLKSIFEVPGHFEKFIFEQKETKIMKKTSLFFRQNEQGLT
jgi:hypothetical protein